MTARRIFQQYAARGGPSLGRVSPATAVVALASASAILALVIADDLGQDRDGDDGPSAFAGKTSAANCEPSSGATSRRHSQSLPLPKKGKHHFHSHVFQPNQSMPIGRLADTSCVRGFRIAAKVDHRRTISSFMEVGISIAQNMRTYQEDSWLVLSKDVDVMAKEARAVANAGGWASWFRKSEKVTPDSPPPGNEPSGKENSGAADGELKQLPESGTDASAILAVFDGHGGDACSRHATQHFHDTFEKVLSAMKAEVRKRSESTQVVPADFSKNALERTLLSLDRTFVKTSKFTVGGSTAVVVAVDFLNGSLICSNVGDSRAVLFRPIGEKKGDEGEVPLRDFPLSSDHSPGTRPDEVERIVQLGGEVKAELWETALVLAAGGDPDSCQRVYQPNGVGGLNMTRALGDDCLKPLVIPNPETTITPFQDDVETEKSWDGVPSFLVLATDGLWDVMSHEAVAKVIWDIYSNSLSEESTDSTRVAQLAALTLARSAQNEGSKDNITCIVVQLPLS